MNPSLPTRPARLLLAALLLLLACNRHGAEPDSYTLVYPDYRPLLIARPALEAAVTTLPPQAMHNTGKLYLLGSYVLVNEKYQGIHIIDNHDPAHPRPAGFLRIPGNVDMAVRGSVLYADSGPDLVAIDLRNPEAGQVVGRVRDAFPELPMPVGGLLEDASQPANRPAGSVIIGWRKLAAGEAIPVKIPVYTGGSGPLFYSTTTVSTASSGAAASPANAGKAGSLARFAVLGSTLYAVDDQHLRLFDVQNAAQPTAGPVVYLGLGIETIFPQDHYLFLGSQTGMFIYDVATPAAPKLAGTVSHARSCDPVVVEGNFAYVTLRSTTAGSSSGIVSACGSSQSNQLDVIDLTTLSRPQLARTYALSGPQGLGAENGRLYVCDDVLRVFDTTQAPALTQVQQLPVQLTDVIPNGSYLLGVGAGGLYQFALGSTTVQQLSVLPITPTP